MELGEWAQQHSGGRDGSGEDVTVDVVHARGHVWVSCAAAVPGGGAAVDAAALGERNPALDGAARGGAARVRGVEEMHPTDRVAIEAGRV